jgi:hypothetical protein
MSNYQPAFTEEQLRRRVADSTEALIADVQRRLMADGFFDADKLQLQSEIAIDGVVLYTKESQDALLGEIGRLSSLLLNETIEAVVAAMFSDDPS